MRNLLDRLRDFFTFSSGERKGIIVLVLLLIIISGINLMVLLNHPSVDEGELPEWMKDSGAVLLPASTAEISPDSSDEILPFNMDGNGAGFYFDPNDASFEELVQMGLSKKVSHTILNYRSKGGSFRQPDDLKKIFGLSSSQYSRISKYILIRPSARMHRNYTDTFPARENRPLDVNHADSALFEKLPGIGPVLAHRIIRYRLLLGGYISPVQIREVYGISDSLFLTLSNHLVADTTLIRKININTASEKEMARHPYLGRYIAAGIIRYRKHVSHIENINELKLNGLIPPDQFEKIKNYLSI